MSNTKREPLLSDKVIRDTFMYGSLIKDAEHGFMSGANYVRDFYEAARAKDAELIQTLVDALAETADYGSTYPFVMDALSDAAGAGFKPSDQ